MISASETFDPQNDGAGEVCIANIGPAERRKRLNFGIVALVVGIVLLAVLMLLGLSRWWRLILFLPFAGAATGYYQWHDKTCVAHSRHNTMQLEDTPEPITDAVITAQIAKQARRVQVKSVVAGTLMTLVALALPVVE